MVELSPEAYAAIGALVVTNAGSLFKIFRDWQRAEKEEDKEAAEARTKHQIETAVLREQITALTIAVGEIKEGFRDLRQDFNGAYGKWREKNGKT